MADINDKTQNVSITNNDETKTVSVVTDGSKERLAVDAAVNVITSGTATSNIFKQAEFTATSRNEADVTGVTHTVTAGKQFALVWFGASADSPAPIQFRLKANGVTKMKINLGTGLGGNNANYPITVPVIIANAGEIVKITIEPSYKNATGWTGFIGAEV